MIAVVPARGGSKSIPHKNLTEFLGRPLMGHVIECARRCRSIGAIVCSTEDERIAEVAAALGAEIHRRDPALASDTAPVLDTVRAVLEGDAREWEAVALMQPTSPFILPGHVDGLVDLLQSDPVADAAETISAVPHNCHAYNQRVVEDGAVQFRFAAERGRCYNKQLKPVFFRFGNAIVSRRQTIAELGTFWGSRCLALEVGEAYATDIDGPGDLEYGRWLWETGRVLLPWVEEDPRHCGPGGRREMGTGT